MARRHRPPRRRTGARCGPGQRRRQPLRECAQRDLHSFVLPPAAAGLAGQRGRAAVKAPPLLKVEMTPFPYSVDLHASLGEARELMDAHGIHHLPVTSQRAVVGVITDRDLRSAEGAAAQGALTVADVYIAEVYVVDLNAPLAEVLLTMARRHIGSAIVTRDGKLAGVFTSVDACRCFGEFLRESFPGDCGPEAA